LMQWEWRAGARGPTAHAAPASDALNHAAQRAAQLEATIRHWPRHAGNDPYKRGLEQVAEALRPLLPTDLVIVGYNEFCAPSVEEAIGAAIGQGAQEVVVIASMMTPGGVHAEVEIPRCVALARQRHPDVVIDYLWPFDVQDVAQLLATHVRRRLAHQTT
jgi:sirohydrochlorin cobaltochelatase